MPSAHPFLQQKRVEKDVNVQMDMLCTSGINQLNMHNWGSKVDLFYKHDKSVYMEFTWNLHYVKLASIHTVVTAF